MSTGPGTIARERIGFLGAGVMGAGMVRRMLTDGYLVSVWSRSRERHRDLEAAGAVLRDSIADTVRASDIVLGCLRDTSITRECYLGAGGAIESARAGMLFVEHGTFDPALAVAIAAAADGMDCAFVDAPVSGGPERARSGDLVTMIGGSALAFDRARIVLRSYCRQIVHVGRSGTGEQLKLINQLLVSIHIAAAAEASALVAASGIDASVARETLMGGWAASTMLDRVMPRVASGDFSDSGATVGKLAEVQPLIAAMLASSGIEPRLFPAAHALFDETVASGKQDLDIAAVVSRYSTSPEP